MALDPGTGSRPPKANRKRKRRPEPGIATAPKPTKPARQPRRHPALAAAVDSLLGGVASVERAGTNAVMHGVGQVNTAAQKKPQHYSLLDKVLGKPTLDMTRVGLSAARDLGGTLGTKLGASILGPVIEQAQQQGQGRAPRRTWSPALPAIPSQAQASLLGASQAARLIEAGGLGPDLTKAYLAALGAPNQHVSPWAAADLAALFPIGRAAKGATEAVDALRGAKAAEEAAAAARLNPAFAERQALREAANPEAIQGVLGSARRLNRQQEALRHVQRGERAGRAQAAAEQVGGEAGLRAARAELRGEYAQLPFDRLVKTFGEEGSDQRALLQPEVNKIIDSIQYHPKLAGRQFTIDNTKEAFLKTINGRLPTKSEIRLLEDVFGKEDVQAYFKWRKAYEGAVSAVNLPRTMMASYDLSGLFRQNLVLGSRHPVLFGRAGKAMLRAAVSEKKAAAIRAEINARPTHAIARDIAGVKFTDMHGNVAHREEPFMSTVGERIPVVGRGVKFSNRAFSTVSNVMRQDVFDLLYEHANVSTAGTLRTIFRRAAPALDDLSTREQEKALRAIGSIINVGTGRGGMGADVLEKAAPAMTMLFFSPRLIASRIALLNPIYYARLTPFARQEAARAMLHLFAAGSATLWLLSKVPGVDVGLDARSSDFGKVRIGDTRIDLWGGLQQYVVLAARVAKREYVSSTTGEVKKLTGNYGDKSVFDVASDFTTGKFAPIPSYGVRAAKGTDRSGNPFNPKTEAAKMFIPLGAQNIYETYSYPGPGGGSVAAAITTPLNLIGLGTQTYGAKPKKRRSHAEPGSSSGGRRASRPEPGG